MNPKKDAQKQDGLFIPTRQVTAYSSLLLSLCGVIFMAGYFFGKQHMAEELITKLEHDSFADHISASLCNLYDPEIDKAMFEQQQEIADLNQDESSALQEDVVEIVKEQVEHPEANEQAYYAQLIGYGTRKAADQFAQKLQKNGIPVTVKMRKSCTAQGKETTWYQVVTESFTDRNALDELTQSIARNEKIQGIQIVSC